MKVGDRVVHEIGLGVIKCIDPNIAIGVEFSHRTDLHDCRGFCKKGTGWWCCESELKLEEPMFKVGDVIVDVDKDEAKVLAVLGNVFLKSEWNDFDYADMWYTEKEADNWHKKEEKEKVKVVCEGHEVEIYREDAEKLNLIKK